MTDPAASQPPLVSVVIPTYNRAGLVVQAIDSALAQTLRPIELLVVDDGSSDGTRDALETYAGRIRYFEQPNRGVSAARNRGIAEARGAWIAFLDSDDLWEPNRLELMLDFARRHADVGYVMSGRRRTLGDEGRRTSRTYRWHGRDGYISAEDVLTGVRCGSGMGRRDLIQAVGGFDEHILACEDIDLCLRMSFLTRLAEVSQPLLLHREHGRTLSHSHHVTALGRLRVIEKLERDQPEFARSHSRLIRRFRASAYSRMGRALLTESAFSDDDRREARRHFLTATRLDPLHLDHWRYALISLVAPGLYRRRRGGASTMRR